MKFSVNLLNHLNLPNCYLKNFGFLIVIRILQKMNIEKKTGYLFAPVLHIHSHEVGTSLRMG